MKFPFLKKQFAMMLTMLIRLHNIIDQYEFRKNTILETLDNEGINISKL